MNIKYDLAMSKFVRAEYEDGGKCVTLPETVTVSFSSSLYPTAQLYARFRKDGETVCERCGKTIDITALCKSAGTVEIEVSMLARGEPVKVWRCESIVLSEITGGFEPIPELEAMKTRIATLEQAVRELAKTENEF